ncbi:hypothetical protein B0I37DRAFT_358582 [Chaetomium sp. MPI-CAGE-AT-0009]|nr:hypothetical protein B0I37DRAFT_358582 [Chaetomium sp. MPI-CAGE-AT-0009]
MIPAQWDSHPFRPVGARGRARASISWSTRHQMSRRTDGCDVHMILRPQSSPQSPGLLVSPTPPLLPHVCDSGESHLNQGAQKRPRPWRGCWRRHWLPQSLSWVLTESDGSKPPEPAGPKPRTLSARQCSLVPMSGSPIGFPGTGVRGVDMCGPIEPIPTPDRRSCSPFEQFRIESATTRCIHDVTITMEPAFGFRPCVRPGSQLGSHAP